MKTGGIRPGSSVPSPRRPGAKGQKGGNFGSLLGVAEASNAPSAGVTGGLTSLTSVLAPLAIDASDPDAQRRRAQAYGDDLLDQLEALRAALLAGRVDIARLRDIVTRMRQRQERANDLRLDAILAEIEVRVEVEAAKLGI